MNPLLQQFLIGLTLLNLFTLPFLRQILGGYDLTLDYYRVQPPGVTPLLIAAAVVLSGASLYGIVSSGMVRRAGGRERVECFQALALSALLPVPPLYLPDAGINLCRVALVALVIWALLRRRQRLCQWSAQAMTLFSGLAVVMLVTAAWQAAAWTGATAIAAPESAARIAQTESPPGNGARLVWLIFDELDYGIALERRPDGIELPELDRLLRQSIVGTKVESAGKWTREAIPALLLGERVRSVSEKSPDQLRLTLERDGEEVDFASRPSLFQKAKAAGLRSAVTGWHHPYCRLIGLAADSCLWQPNSDVLDSGRALWVAGLEPPGATLRAFLRAPLRSWFKWADDAQVLHETQFVRRQHLEAFQEIHASALRQAADPRFQLVFLHYNIPHPFGIFDRHKRQFSLAETADYVDNLLLVDQVIGEIRAAVDPNTALLVMSDHSFRPDVWNYRPNWSAEMESLTRGRQDPRIVFALHMPGQETPVVLEEPFNAVLAHDLALAILSARLRSVEDALVWLEEHRRQDR